MKRALAWLRRRWALWKFKRTIRKVEKRLGGDFFTVMEPHLKNWKRQAEWRKRIGK